MESPVVVDKPPEYHGNTRDERGFPFDEEEGSGAWSSLAARHPDIAARLRSRPAAATWARKRRPTSQDAAEDFGDNFSDFDRFPFDDIPPEFREHFPSHWNRRFSSRDEPQTQAAPSPPSPSQQTTSTQTEQDPGPSTQTHLPQYGLRNTVDLGQKSPADPSLVDADDRNQRSMSAPPDSCTANQSHTPKMSAPNHQDGHAPDHQPQSNVRHIPIFVEGRDEPVINKNVDHGTHFGETKPAYVPPPQPQPHIEREQYFPDDGPVFHPPPNFSRAFGTPFNKGFRQGPQPFVQQKVYPQTAFARGASPQRSQSPKPQPHQEEHFVKVPVHHATTKPEPQPRPQQKQPPQQQPHQPPPQQQSHQAPPQQPPSPKQQTPPPQSKPSPNDPITLILSIQTDVLNLMTDVENFTGSKGDKRYLYLDEMLTRNLIKLDNIETDGKENIRQARKEAIKCIQKCIAVLEAKAEKGSGAAQPQDVEMKENADATENVTANGGVEVEMKVAPEEEKVEPQAEQPQAPQEQKDESVPQNPGTTAPEVPQPAEPQAADTRPEEPKVETTDEKKTEEVENKASPKKGAKNVKKRDKSKETKKEAKDSNKEQTEEQKEAQIQIDDKGDKTETQAMEVDGAASQ